VHAIAGSSPLPARRRLGAYALVISALWCLGPGLPLPAAAQQPSWNGTWVGHWENGHGMQIVFAGDDLIAVYWEDDYVGDAKAIPSSDGTRFTITWPSVEAELARDGADAAHIAIHEEGQPELSFGLTREQ
jgi:hypothetical protein